jgi:hypothetical protein
MNGLWVLSDWGMLTSTTAAVLMGAGIGLIAGLRLNPTARRDRRLRKIIRSIKRGEP